MEYKELDPKEKEKKNEENSIISSEKVNMSHQSEFDYLKAFLLFLMINDHLYDSYSTGNYYVYKIMEFVIFVLGAGGFMLSMGVGMKYTRHHEPKDYIERAIILLTQGQLFYIVRDGLPNLIAYWASGNKMFISRAMLVFQTDILTFSGITFIFLALMKKINVSDINIFLISIILNIVALYLFNTFKPPSNYLLSQFLGNFIITDAESFFPFFNYFTFVAFGYWLGGILQRITNKDKFYNLFLIVCLPFETIYYIFRKHYDFPGFPKYFTYLHYCVYPFPDSFASCICNVTALAIFYKIDKMLKGKTPGFITHCGKRLNEYYIISSLFILNLKTILIIAKGEDFLSKMTSPHIFSIIIIIFSRIIIEINDKYIHFAITTLKKPLRNYIFALIWIATIIILIYTYPKVESHATVWNDYLKNGHNININYYK